MEKLPQQVIEAWNNRKGPIVFTTVNDHNIPNAIYATCVNLYNDSTILIADNFFAKTKMNIFKNSVASVLFITEEDKSYQLKGSIQYHIRGKYFEDMKKWNPEKLPGHAVAIINIDEIYSGAEKIG